MYSIYNQTWPNQPLESQPLHRGSLKITCSDPLTHTTAKSILWAWDLLYPSFHQNATPCRIQSVCYVTPTSLLQFISLLKFLSLIYSLWYRLSFAHTCAIIVLSGFCHLSSFKCITHIPTHLILPSICHCNFASFFLVWSLFVSSGGSFSLGQSGLLHNCTGQMDRSCIISIRHSHKVGFNGLLLSDPK